MTRAVGLSTNLRPNMVLKLTPRPGVAHIARKLRRPRRSVKPIRSVAPAFIGEGIPLIARRPRHMPLELLSSDRFEDGLVQSRYRVC